MADIVLNVLVFLATAVLVLSFPRKDGQWYPERIIKAFRFFTCQSNAFCAAACLAEAVSALCGDIPEWIWMLKYIGTAAVTVTMLTVFLFLAPGIGKGWAGILLTHTVSDFFMHLLTPLAALFSFCLLEKREMSFVQALAGMLPVILYGILYIYKTQFAPEGKRWEDFYGFNRNGRMLISALGMTAGTFSVCMMLMAFQNL